MANEKENNRPQPEMRPGRGVHIPGQKLDMKTAKRVIKYLLAYKWRLMAVVCCIIFSALAGVYGSKFLQTLVDGHIDPMIKNQSADMSGLLKEIIILAVVYVLGALSTFAYNRIMLVVAQSVLKNIRDTMFAKCKPCP